jgi:hypothetical protein
MGKMKDTSLSQRYFSLASLLSEGTYRSNGRTGTLSRIWEQWLGRLQNYQIATLENPLYIGIPGIMTESPVVWQIYQFGLTDRYVLCLDRP